jgi:hypothetical protein
MSGSSDDAVTTLKDLIGKLAPKAAADASDEPVCVETS